MQTTIDPMWVRENPDEAAALIVQLQQERDAARAALREAADEIEAWGAYAGAYFQDKHDLEGTVARFRALSDHQTEATP